nr:unnamed protein product [Callosobruchus chinensis]
MLSTSNTMIRELLVKISG